MEKSLENSLKPRKLEKYTPIFGVQIYEFRTSDIVENIKGNKSYEEVRELQEQIGNRLGTKAMKEGLVAAGLITAGTLTYYYFS